MQLSSKKGSILILNFGFMAFFASLIQNIYTPIIPQLQSNFNVPLLWINTTVGGFIFIVAIMQIILGKFIDSIDSKKLLLLSMSITLVTSLICSSTNNFIVFAIFRLIQAIGCGMIPLIVITLLADLSTEDNRASVMSNYQIFLSCAPALAPILGGLIGNYYGYSGIFFTLTVVSVILLASLFFINFSNDKNKRIEVGKVNYSTFFKSNTFNIMIAFGFLVFFTYFSLLVYMPILLNRNYDISTALTGFLYLPITVSIIIGSILYKKLSKRYTNNLFYIVTALSLTILLILFSILNSSNLYIMLAITFLIGLIVGIVPALISTILSKEFPKTKGAALGMFNFIRYIGMALGSITIGFFSDDNIIYYYLGISILLIVIFILSKLKIKLNVMNNVEQY